MKIKNINRAINNYRESFGDELSDLLIDLFVAVTGLEYELDWKPNADAVAQVLRDGSYALAYEEPVVDSEWLKHATRMLFEAIDDNAEKLDWSAFDKVDFSHALTKDDATLKDLAEHLELSDENLDEQIIKNRFYLAYSQALAVFGEAVHNKLAAIIEEVDFLNPTFCPVCGSQAALAIQTEGSLSEGSPKMLWCSTCHFKWRYSRVKCEVCGNTNQHQLHYLYDSADAAHKIHICEKCGSAFPVYDEGKLTIMSKPEIEEFVLMGTMDKILSQDIDIEELFGQEMPDLSGVFTLKDEEQD
ncbi:MAG: formate dehydrogenase accessory protein FdhE [Coriobacteriia bacterium]|nr:formate dehydrogenase accessory protein FdhE [Coriobacteriia bacterium]